jgi:putative phosphonate metabolism protein
MAPRYAIYFVPAAESALYRFGSTVLGYDAYSGRAVPFPSEAGPDWPAIVRAPSIYGFHATLKAPFRLTAGASEADLLEALRMFAADQPVVDGGPMVLRTLGSFIAMVPASPSSDIDRLAARCVEDFDSFRAPLAAEERSRRLKAGLTAAQIERLDRWGYPYVFDEFRFHMTMTGALDAARRAAALDVLAAALRQSPGAADLAIDQLAIARQNETGMPFCVIATAALGHPVLRPFATSF